MRQQILLNNPNPKTTNRVLKKTSWYHDKEILNNEWGDFPVTDENIFAARNTYPDKPVLAFKESLRLADGGLLDINDPKYGKALHMARLRGLNFSYSRTTG